MARAGHLALHVLPGPNARARDERAAGQPRGQRAVPLPRGHELAFVVLAATAIFADPEARRLAYLTLIVANLSQLVIDLRVQRLGLARGAFFLQILAGDALFAALNGVALALDAR